MIGKERYIFEIFHLNDIELSSYDLTFSDPIYMKHSIKI